MHTWTGADPSGYWSASGNWSPAGVPVNGADLVFPGGLPSGDMVSTNDLTDSIFRSIRFEQAGGHTIRGNPITLTNHGNVINNSGTNVIACDLFLSGTPSTPTSQGSSIWGSWPAGELTVIGNVGGGSLYISTRVVIRGQFTGGSLRLRNATLALYGDNPYAVSVETQLSEILVQGSQPDLNITMLYEMETLQGSSLSGDGLVGDVIGSGDIISDSTLSVKNVNLSYLYTHFNGTNVGEYGRLVASGNVSFYAGRLRPSAGFNPQAGQVYTIVEKTSPGLANAFLGPEGTITYMNGMPFRVSYVGGDGNDVTLTAMGTPITVTITNPPNGAVFEAPASFTLGASAARPGGSVTNVQFFLDATSLGNDTSSPYSVPVSGLAVGNYTLTAVASDHEGLRATNSIAITVNAQPVDPTFSDANWISIGGLDGPSGSPEVRAAVVDGSGNLYVGGFFTISGVATNIAKWNGSRWSALGSGMKSNVYTLAVSDSGLFVGGNFWTAGGTPARNIGKWDGSSWSALGSGVDGLVFALAASGSNLYAGGRFEMAGGIPATNIAKWDGSTWSAVPGSGINGQVNALAVSGSDLYAAGQAARPLTANRIAKWDGSSWIPLGGDVGSVSALAVSGSDLYAGATKWDGSNWIPLGSGMGGVRALAVLGNDLYAGGSFTTAGVSPANRIAKWDGATWHPLGSGLSGGSNPWVFALAVSGSDLYVGGWFTTAGDKFSPGIAKARIASAAESITRSGSSATIQFSGVVGYQYHVQRTDSLTPPTTWTTLTTSPLSPAADGSLTFSDTNAPPSTAYYRLVQH